MPTNDYHIIPIDSILVGERFRKAFGDIDAFVASIAKFGLLEPLVVARDYRLLAGGRRLAALQKLGWLTVPVHYIDEVDDLRLREIEYEENVQRADLSWQERAALTAAIDELKKQIYGQSADGRRVGNDNSPEASGWSIRRTADAIQASPATVHSDIRLANGLEVLPSLAKQTSRSNALKELDRLEEAIVNEQDRRARLAQYAQFESSFVCGDSTSLISQLQTGSVDCIITDPPYGTNLQLGRFGARDGDNDDFDDSPESALALLRSIAPECRRVLKPNGHLYTFFGARLWNESRHAWQAAGFDVRETINIWFKPGASTGAGDWDYNFAPAWEPFLYAGSPDRRLAYKRKNVFSYAVELGGARHHPTQKPIELLRELIQLSTAPGDVVLDPFAGVASTLVAASQLRRRFIGYELNPRFHGIGLRRLVDEGKERPFVKKEEL